jgi:subtilisin family serine protease
MRLLLVGAVLLAGLTTPVAAAQSDGPVAHFVVLGPKHESLDRTERSVREAGGTVLQSWPQIGVVIATSPAAGFAADVRDEPGVVGAGATRNLAELAPEPASVRPAPPAELVPAVAGVAAGEPLEANQWNLRQIGADRAISGGSRDVLVGVLDTGVDASHPDLAANVDAANSVGCANDGVPDTSPEAWLPTTNLHGTHVAGIIAAPRNGIGVAGVAPNVRVASVRVVNERNAIYPEYAICGFVWAADHGMDVTNSSYFVDPWYLWCETDPDQGAVVEAMRRAVAYAAGKDVVNVASLNNSNWDLSHDIVDSSSPTNGTPVTRETDDSCHSLPAELPGVVGVSSVGPEERKSFFSNYGRTETDVTAPGGDPRQVADTPDGIGRVLSTVPGGYGYAAGTSMAAPHAAGVVALLRSTHPRWPADLVRAALSAQADPIPCPPGVYDPDGTGDWLATCEGGRSGRGFYGAGQVDALDAATR